jgi:hypothetical protein
VNTTPLLERNPRDVKRPSSKQCRMNGNCSGKTRRRSGKRTGCAGVVGSRRRQERKGQLDLDAQGYITSSDGMRTNIDGVFVASDVCEVRYKQAITAAGMGRRAAMDPKKYYETLEARHKAEPIIIRS